VLKLTQFLRSKEFLGHAGFYRRFIKDFSKVSKSLCNLLEQDVSFVFDDACMDAFLVLKEKLTSTPIIATSNWNLPFELMCDTNNHFVGAVLGQRKGKLVEPTCANYFLIEF